MFCKVEIGALKASRQAIPLPIDALVFRILLGTEARKICFSCSRADAV
jgi:hypothetical protein